MTIQPNPKGMPNARSQQVAAVVMVGLMLGVMLTGTAESAPSDWTPSSASWTQPAGTTSPSKSFTLSPSPSVTLSANASLDDPHFDFASNGCTSGVTTPCTVTVTFTPSAAATYTATLSDPAGGSGASLTGTGTGAPKATVSPSSLSFGGVSVGSSSAAKSVKLTNSGNATLTISSISLSAQYARTACPGSLSAGASCTISVTFKPTTVGSHSGTLTIHDNAGSGSQSVSLSGSGVAPVVKLSPTTLTFEHQRKGTTSPSQSITLSNVGKVTLHVTSVSASGDFSQKNTCTSVAAEGSCTITVTFRPTALGTRSGAMIVKDDAGSQVAKLSGLGVYPAFSINGNKIKFSKTGLGELSAPRNVKIKNSGTDKLYIQKLTVTGDFSQTNTCQPYLNPGITCTISVTFNPSRLQGRSGALKIVHDLGIATVKLSGFGIPGIGPTTGPSPPEPKPIPATAPAPREEVQNDSHIMRFLLGGGLFVLLAGLLLMFLSRGRGGEPVPGWPEVGGGPEAAEIPADDGELALSGEGGDAGSSADMEPAVVSLSSLESGHALLTTAPWKEAADQEADPGAAGGGGNGSSVGRKGGASELKTVVPEGEKPLAG